MQVVTGVDCWPWPSAKALFACRKTNGKGILAMFELTPEQQQFVEAQVTTGGFKDPTEVVQAGIELLRQAAERDYAETVQAIHQAMPDMEAGLGRTIEEVDVTLREKFGFSKPT